MNLSNFKSSQHCVVNSALFIIYFLTSGKKSMTTEKGYAICGIIEPKSVHSFQKFIVQLNYLGLLCITALDRLLWLFQGEKL